jgi:hypothetical protein
MKNFTLIIVMVALMVQGIAAQQIQRCITDEYLAIRKAADPTIQDRMDSIENRTEIWISNHPRMEMKYRITIPVVVHVVWYIDSADQNISDAQVQSQIEVLNEDYNRQNADTINTPSYFKSIASRVPFEFCLASRDPNGNWTNGIVRKSTTNPCIGGYGLDDVKCPSLGGDTAWDPNSYLNIWVCAVSSGILGWCPPPAGTLYYGDGAVVNYQAFGRGPFNLLSHYNLGRTTTHEVGHWLNLFHPWGQGGGNCCTCSDYCYDTPYQDGPTFGCPSGPQISCNNGPNGNMYEVYMDYTDDACMNMFSFGQCSRMMATINGVRQQFLNSKGCLATGINFMNNDNKITLFPNPAMTSITLHSTMSIINCQLSIEDVLGNKIYQQQINNSTQSTIDISTWSEGVYFYEVIGANETTRGKFIKE